MEETPRIHVNPSNVELQSILSKTTAPNLVAVVFTTTSAAVSNRPLLLSSSYNVDVICFMAAPELMCLHTNDAFYSANTASIHTAFDALLKSSTEMYDVTTTAGSDAVLCAPLGVNGKSHARKQHSHLHTECSLSLQQCNDFDCH